MSKLLKKYLTLKIDNSDYFYLFESGIFYIFIADDAKYISKILNLKLTNLNSFTPKCGFPKTKLDKYLAILESHNCKIKIIDSSSFQPYLPSDYLNNQKVKDIIQTLSNIETYKLSISQAYDFINNLKSRAIQILKEIELNYETKE